MPKLYSFVISLGPGRMFDYGTNTLQEIERSFYRAKKIDPDPLLVISEEDGTGY